jgi:threonine/homoserine/homoserine lactone efflux protein
MDVLLDARILGAIGLMVLLTIAPGPDMALVTGTALLHGQRAAFRTTLGIATGTIVWATLAGIGVAALLQSSAEAFAVIRLAGALYLGFLGIQALHAIRGPAQPPSAIDDAGPARSGRQYLRGLLTNLLNPKVGLVYTTLVPQLVDPGDPIALVSIAVGIAHAVIGVAWLALLAAVVDRAGPVLRRPRIQRALSALTGTVLVAFGLRVAADPT